LDYEHKKVFYPDFAAPGKTSVCVMVGKFNIIPQASKGIDRVIK